MSNNIASELNALIRINKACGGTAGVRRDVINDDDVDYSKMSPYDVAQYKLALRMARFRQTAKEYEEMPSNANISRRAQVANQLRREQTGMNEDLRKAKELARGDANDRRAAELLEHHLRNTEKMYRSVTGRENSHEEEGSASSPYHDDRLEDYQEGRESSGPTLRDDPEFQQFFQEVTQRDKQIDQHLDNVYAGVQRLKHSAGLITEELKIQSALLQDTEDKVDNVQAKLKGLNRRLKDTVKQIDKDRICLYFFCLIILTGIIVAVVMVFKK